MRDKWGINENFPKDYLANIARVPLCVDNQLFIFGSDLTRNKRETRPFCFTNIQRTICFFACCSVYLQWLTNLFLFYRYGNNKDSTFRNCYQWTGSRLYTMHVWILHALRSAPFTETTQQESWRRSACRIAKPALYHPGLHAWPMPSSHAKCGRITQSSLPWQEQEVALWTYFQSSLPEQSQWSSTVSRLMMACLISVVTSNPRPVQSLFRQSKWR